jgi:hypothetical protein
MHLHARGMFKRLSAIVALLAAELSSTSKRANVSSISPDLEQIMADTKSSLTGSSIGALNWMIPI